MYLLNTSIKKLLFKNVLLLIASRKFAAKIDVLDHIIDFVRSTIIRIR